MVHTHKSPVKRLVGKTTLKNNKDTNDDEKRKAWGVTKAPLVALGGFVVVRVRCGLVEGAGYRA